MIEKFVSKLNNNKIGRFIYKYHILYLIPAILLVLMKVFVYRLIGANVSEIHHINMVIDEYIPMIKYFYVFYFTYYWYPAVIILVLILYNRKSFWITLTTIILVNIIAMSTFAIYQVQMIRPIEYEIYNSYSEVFKAFKESNNISSFFDVCIGMQYHMDKGAYNCFPSLHASLGTIEVLLSINLFKDQKKLPLWFNITSFILGIGTTLSTVFIKQHYFIDMIAGILLTVLVYVVLCLIVNKLEKDDKLTFYKNTLEHLTYKSKKDLLNEKKELENNSIYKIHDYVNFKYRDELNFGYIYNIKFINDKYIYDIQIAGQCPSIINDINIDDIIGKKMQ